MCAPCTQADASKSFIASLPAALCTCMHYAQVNSYILCHDWWVGAEASSTTSMNSLGLASWVLHLISPHSTRQCTFH
jgi:hypothetical protein